MILQVNNLTKIFGSFTAVNSISFAMEEGEILGFLGPNGAGKTTTMQMLLSVLTPTSGEIFYFGKNLNHHRSEILDQVNFSSTYADLPYDLTVKECLSFLSYLYYIPNRRQRIAEMIELFKLEDLLGQQITSLSAGQKTRVYLAKALLNRPKVLLLDEPTASLDPDIADYIRSALLKLHAESGVSILFTSHNMAEVEQLCSRVLFLNQGAIVANNTPAELAKTIQISHITLVPLLDHTRKLTDYCAQLGLVSAVTNGRVVIDIHEKKIAGFLQSLADQKISYDEISIDKPDLEDYFLSQARKDVV